MTDPRRAAWKPLAALGAQIAAALVAASAIGGGLPRESGYTGAFAAAAIAATGGATLAVVLLSAARRRRG